MPLNWNIKNCTDFETLLEKNADDWPVTECMIYACMIVGMAKITADNAATFWRRVHAWETINGPINTSQRFMEPNDITRRIGLSTNASTLSPSAWRAKLARALQEMADSSWRRTDAGTITRMQADERMRALVAKMAPKGD